MKTNQPIIILALLCGQSSLSASIPTFTRIATGAIATDEGVSTGCAWGDYNNDGYEDLFVACSQPGAQNLLYSNNRDGSFSRTSNGSVVTDGGNSAACIWGDFDNDGFLDLFVTQTLESGNRLYRNHGDGTFSPVEEGSVVTDGEVRGVVRGPTLVAWGYNEYGQVTGSPEEESLASPVSLRGQVLTGVTAIAAGAEHTVALFGTVLPRPSLNVSPNGNALVLSWPTNAAGFTLQSAPSLTSPVVWTDFAGLPVVFGARFTVTNGTSGTPQFYRLRMP